MKNPSRSFFFLATLSILLVLAGAFITGLYSGRNYSLTKLGLGLCFGGAVSLIASVVYKKQKGNLNSPR